jgi:hypothetical protein
MRGRRGAHRPHADARPPSAHTGALPGHLRRTRRFCATQARPVGAALRGLEELPARNRLVGTGSHPRVGRGHVPVPHEVHGAGSASDIKAPVALPAPTTSRYPIEAPPERRLTRYAGRTVAPSPLSPSGIASAARGRLGLRHASEHSGRTDGLRLASEHSGQIDVIAPAERLRREQTRISWIPPPMLQSRPKSTEPPVVGDPQKRPRRRLVRCHRIIPPFFSPWKDMTTREARASGCPPMPSLR